MTKRGRDFSKVLKPLHSVDLDARGAFHLLGFQSAASLQPHRVMPIVIPCCVCIIRY